MVAPVERGVHEDKVEALLGMAFEPSPPVIDVAGEAGVGLDRGDLGIAVDQLQIAGIDFDAH